MSFYYIPSFILVLGSLMILIQLCFKRRHSFAYLTSGLSLLAALFLQLYLQKNESLIEPLFTFNAQTSFISLLLFMIIGLIWSQIYHWLETLSEQKEEYYLLFLLTALGGVIMVSSNHFASFFMGLELMSLSFIGLIAYCGHDQKAQEAGIKYLILSAIASAFILMGTAILYLQFGSLSFSNLMQTPSIQVLPQWTIVCAIIFIFTGLFFKLSLVPCHLWIADLFEGAPLVTTALLATLSKLAAFIVLWRLMNLGQWQQYQIIIDIIVITSIASMFVGNVLALFQKNLLRLVAYSSIAHFGYLLIVLLLINNDKVLFSTQSFNTQTLLFYLVAYLFTLVGVFSILIQLPKVKMLDDLNGLFWHKPFIAITLILLMLSLAGIPLTLGFMAKFYLVMAAISQQLWLLLAALVLGSTVGLFYYLKVILAMVKRPKNDIAFNNLLSDGNNLSLNILILFLVIGFGIFPTSLSQFIQQIAN
ncbi:NADH-quinone oxidoreductase subunit N [Pseudoalteromonas denitrificans]|uniref:NADH-quinone oxidoreductase subunit N n=1 Tax=Pseudoalteromonas denitrificans DSM 6059 TaxID=1123010 RepID=A0A1I1P346_9GAMM|nr:NADH-quinone oxidoreductase subunit N [Pseudoalteromonas denitrificans]SFD04351.1 NADH dehydrogenase subunit N [Pseudoalteromonas denitrificans DSM 6059]